MQPSHMLDEWGPLSLPAGMSTTLPATMQKGQACGHGFAHDSCCVEARNTSLYPNNLGNLQDNSLGENKSRHVFVSWVSPSLSDQGGNPALGSLGSKPPLLLKHFALGKGMATELELQTTSYMMNSLDAEGHLVLLIDSFNRDSLKSIKLAKERACKDKLRTKGDKKQQTKQEQMQLDQARLHSSQRKLEQEKKQTIGQNSLGANSLRRTSGFETNNLGTLGHKSIRTNSLGIEDHEVCTESFEQQPQAFERSSLQIWKILIDTGAELSVAPQDFAASIQLSPCNQDLQLRTATGKAIKIFGVRTVQLLTPGFSFCMTFVIADVQTPLLGLGSLLASNLSLQLDNNLGHHLGNIAGEKILLEQRGLQLYLSACPTQLELIPCRSGSLLNDSLLPDANLGATTKMQLRKEVCNQGGEGGSSLPPRSLRQHRQQTTKAAIGQQALPEARTKHKKVGRTNASKLELEKTNFKEKMQLALLEKEDPRASLDQNTGKHISLRIIAILSLMNRWQLKTSRIQTASPHKLTKPQLRELGLKESVVDSELLIGDQLVVFQHDDCLLVGGEKTRQECFFTKLSASFYPIETQQLDEHTPLSFLDSQLELNQADRSISLHPTNLFYSELLGRYSLEDAKGGEIPTIKLGQRTSRWKETILDAKRSKLYKETVGNLVWLSLLRPDVASAVHNLCQSYKKPTEKDEEELRSLLKYIQGTQAYTVSLKPPRKWRKAKSFEILAFATSWLHSSRSSACVSLSFLGVHLAAFIQQATSKVAAELGSVRLASTLAFHTKSLLREMQLGQPLNFRVLTRGPVAQKLGLSQQTRHIELSSLLGQFQLSKVQPHQNLAEQLTNINTACSLHRLLPKLQMHVRPAGMRALPTVRGEGRAFSSSSFFFIGQLSRAPAMEKLCSQLSVNELSGKELGKTLALPELESALANGSLQRVDELVAAYSAESFHKQHLQQKELSAAYATSLPTELGRTALAMELESKALTLSTLQQKKLRRFQAFQQDSSTRACDSQRYASTSSPRTSRKQNRALKIRIFPSLFRAIVILMIQSLTLYSLSFLFSISSLNCTSLSFQSRFPNGWAHELAELDDTTLQDELLTTFGDLELVKNELEKTCREEENEKQEEQLQILLWEQELEKHLADKPFLVNQLQKNLLENDEQKKLENQELQEKNFDKSFQKMIFQKLVALMPEKHFALAASSRLLGNEAALTR